MENNLEEGVEAMEVLEEDEGDEVDSFDKATVEYYYYHKLRHFQ